MQVLPYRAWLARRLAIAIAGVAIILALLGSADSLDGVSLRAIGYLAAAVVSWLVARDLRDYADDRARTLEDLGTAEDSRCTDERGRLTVPDLAYVLASMAFLSAIYPVFWESFNQNVSEMSTGQAYLFQLILPLALLVLFSIIFVKATAGVRT